ncbi:MAG: tetratricopeptide (TPR) repeat protein [Candidatus Latescibacterota bacterium]
MPISYRAALALVLLLGLGLRFVGWDRGEGVIRSEGETIFYSFHPDEETLLRASLELQSPLEPPLTAYGLVPLYLAKGALALAGADVPDMARLYRVARALALLCAALSLWLTWSLAQRRLGRGAALLALLFVACAPLAIQQAHFYTVDGVFVLVLLLFFAAWESGIEANKRYLLAGVLVGVAGAVRFNGLALGLALLVGHCAQVESWRQLPSRLKEGKLWGAALAALTALIVLQPYLLTNPTLLLQGQTTDDFLYSLRLAQGDIVRPWSLVDMHTLPYMHYWTNLWPTAVGWPLTLLMAAGIVWTAWYRFRAEAVALSWCVLCFLSIGALHTKHVRYLLPLLPFLAIFSAQFIEWIWQRNRRLGAAVASVPVLHVVVYGMAFTGIYAAEDSRIEAARWIEANVEKGARIGVESGAFTLQRLIAQPSYQQRTLSVNALFGARGYLGCGAAAEFLWDRVRPMGYIAVVDVNRQRQFRAVPDLYPAVASFYEKLWAGELGFKTAQRFKVYPHLAAIRFVDDDAEPSFLAYDHPAVRVFAREDEEKVLADWAAWRSALAASPACVDEALRSVLDLYALGDFSQALSAVEDMLNQYPDFVTGHFVAASIHHRLGDTEREKEQVRRYVRGYREENAYLVPWAAAASLLLAGAGDMAYAVLQHGQQLTGWIGEDDRLRMGASYELLGSWSEKLEGPEKAAAIYALAAGVEPSVAVYVRLGMLFYAAGQLEKSTSAYESALALDVNDDTARVNYGWNLYRLGHLDEAAAQFEHVLTTRESSVAAFNLGLVYLALGRDEQAEEAYARAVEVYGAEVARSLGAVDELRESVRRLGRGQQVLERHWPQDL